MNAVELVKNTCKSKGISVAKLERELDFGNGYIGKLKKDAFPVDKALKISEYLGIDVGLLIGLDSPKAEDAENVYYIDAQTAEIAKAVYENPELRLLFDAAKDSKPQDIKMAAEMLSRFKETNIDG